MNVNSVDVISREVRLRGVRGKDRGDKGEGELVKGMRQCQKRVVKRLWESERSCMREAWKRS